MSDAVYGLLGALGGAAVAGAAAYWGPLQLQNRARREAQAERALAQAEAAETQRLELLRAQVARVVLVRRSIAVWDDLLNRTLRAIGTERRADPEEFRQAADHARAEASSALYEALNDGLYIPITDRSYDDIETIDDEPDAAARARESTWVLDVFDRATEHLGRALTQARGSGGLHETFLEVQDAHRCRVDLSQRLMEHVERITDITTIEIRGDRAGPGGVPQGRSPG
ncbi:hypothetical protein P1P75_24060 [Streptomyces sp. ID05-39B]|uniref:hypothetical protein n=1 Tax=Streptomyces sp. ID05-39B TaxID=3028664 RepID=UPI0029B2F68B|nr:hypothetical protein [Streptomyces sp. ID05-39B]MDX3529407.1 hypothetical protein [Streptomyces sp. ID05-39B]